jgi:formate dehydrogenase assembly factor FdhD
MWKRSVKVLKFSEYNRSKTNTYLVMERPRTLVTPDGPLVTFECCPQHEREMALGYILCTQQRLSTLSEYTLEGSQIHWIPGEVVAPPRLPELPTLKIDEIYRLTSQFQEAALLYKDTGTTHSAALANEHGIISHSEDLDPTNALYKVVGIAADTAQLSGASILLTSGKIDQATVIQCHQLGLSFIISRSAPTDLAIDYAGNKNITILGFARGVRFSIYSCPDKVR